MKNGEPISTLSGAKLIKGIGRQPWLLNHDEIVLQKKLGEGAFGEVIVHNSSCRPSVLVNHSSEVL